MVKLFAPPPSPPAANIPPGGGIYNEGDFLALAEAFLASTYPLGLRYHQGEWWAATLNDLWEPVNELTIKSVVYKWIALQRWRARKRVWPIPTSRTIVSFLLDALLAVALIDEPQDFNGIALRDGVIDPASRSMRLFDADEFVTWTLPFSSAEIVNAPATDWLAFLAQGSTPDDIDLLQEWFGYCLLGGNRYQKTFWMYGEPGCGKSTICKILIALISQERVAIRKEETFRNRFNDDLIGKRLVYAPDFRSDSKGAKAALDFLLTVGGADPILIEGKHKKPFSAALGLKILYTSNEMPMFRDTTAAALRRLLLWHRKKNFEIEDPGVEERLLAQLGSIFSWALEGAARIIDQRGFDASKQDKRLRRYTARATNVTFAFLSDVALFDPNATVSKLDLFSAWRSYAEERGEFQRFTFEAFIVSVLQTGKQLSSGNVRADDDMFYGLTVRSGYRFGERD